VGDDGKNNDDDKDDKGEGGEAVGGSGGSPLSWTVAGATTTVAASISSKLTRMTIVAVGNTTIKRDNESQRRRSTGGVVAIGHEVDTQAK
jgi:hypothetical protein